MKIKEWVRKNSTTPSYLTDNCSFNIDDLFDIYISPQFEMGQCFATRKYKRGLFFCAGGETMRPLAVGAIISHLGWIRNFEYGIINFNSYKIEIELCDKKLVKITNNGSLIGFIEYTKHSLFARKYTIKRKDKTLLGISQPPLFLHAPTRKDQFGKIVIENGENNKLTIPFLMAYGSKNPEMVIHNTLDRSVFYRSPKVGASPLFPKLGKSKLASLNLSSDDLLLLVVVAWWSRKVHVLAI